jgi:hypothetical protein
MFWKSLVCLGLVCVLAAPALAAPTMAVELVRDGSNKPLLTADGEFQWRVSIAPDAALFTDHPPNGVGGSVATEIGFTSTTQNAGNVVVGAKNATNFPLDTTGNSPFAAPIDGHQTGVVVDANKLFASLGSMYFLSGGNKEMLVITTHKPATVAANGGLTTTLSVSGAAAYGGNGRIAQAGVNYDVATGSSSVTVVAGDANFDGNVNGLDLSILATNFNTNGKIWTTSDWTGEGDVNGLDLSVLAGNFNFSGSPPGLGAGSVVPEPSSLTLVGLAVLAGLGLLRRK